LHCYNWENPSSKCREKFALGWDRVRYFSRVWANVKLANWLINKKYLTSVKGKTLLASEEALKFYDDAKNIASYQFSRWLVSSQPSLTCKSQVWYARKWKPSSHNGRSKCLTCTISHGDSWRIYAFIRKTKLVYWRHVLHPVRMYIYIYICRYIIVNSSQSSFSFFTPSSSFSIAPYPEKMILLKISKNLNINLYINLKILLDCWLER